MTDLVTASEVEPTATMSATPVADNAAPDVQWAPAEPVRSKKKLWLWIGIPAGALLAGAAAASMLLIAPGTSVAGVPVGFMTAGAATDAINQRLSETTLELGGGITVTGADLGARVDAQALADSTFSERPMWNLTQWFGEPVDAPVSTDQAKATAALRAALPASFTDPVAATVAFDGTSFVAVPAVAGTGVDTGAITAQLHDAFVAGATEVSASPAIAAVESPATTAKAQAAADSANAMLPAAGFYVGEERTVPVDAAVAASWLTITADDKGLFTVTADATKIQPFVDGLAPLVNRAAANGAVITDSEGTVLETTIPGADGRVLGDTSQIAKQFADQLAAGNGAYVLPVEVTPAVMTTQARMLEVNLSEQRLYLKENGNVVDSWPISSGIDQSPTTTGHFTIQNHYRSQTMTSTSATDPYWNYEVPNVEWVMYFHGGEAFHGIYWHNNFGEQMSHGCVGMPNYRAQQIYEWSPEGTDVWIHN